jgi:hypothetical protein
LDKANLGEDGEDKEGHVMKYGLQLSRDTGGLLGQVRTFAQKVREAV